MSCTLEARSWPFSNAIEALHSMLQEHVAAPLSRLHANNAAIIDTPALGYLSPTPDEDHTQL